MAASLLHHNPAMKPPLRHPVEHPPAVVTVTELVPSRGPITESSGRKILAPARELAGHRRFDALSITDHPGGHPMPGAGDHRKKSNS